MVRNGPKDTEVTPVVPCYYSPGLPVICMQINTAV
jgi:hypothetical protein